MTRWTPTDYNPDDFANRRHIGPSPAEMEAMLKAVGADSLDALIGQTIPAAIRQDQPLDADGGAVDGVGPGELGQ